MKGRLADRSPADILSEIQGLQASGILRLQRGEVVRQAFIDSGTMIRFAASTLPTESMTVLFMQKFGITEEMLRQATAAKKTDELVGTTLVRLGFLTREQLSALTEEHIRRVIYGVLCEADGDFAFQRGALPFREQLDGGLRTALLILEWVRDVPDLDWVRRRVGPPDGRVRIAPRPPEGYQSVPLNPAEGYTMSRVDGSASISDICAVSPMGEETTLRALCALSLAGLLELPDGAAIGTESTSPVTARAGATPGAGSGSSAPRSSGTAGPAKSARLATARAAVLPGRIPRNGGAPKGRPAPKPAPRIERVRPATSPDLESEMLRRFESMTNQNLYQVLEVASTATEDEVRRAYYALARRFHPDKFTRDEIKSKAEKVFGHITEAYSTLSHADSRKKYDEDLATNAPRQQETLDGADMARQNFKHGKEMFDRGKFGEALSFLQNACEQDPKKADHFHYLAMTQSKNPRWKKDAETNFLAAINLDPSNAEIYAQLGSLYDRGGLQTKAREMWKKALQWDPANQQALGGLAAEDGSKKGLLGIFKK